MRNNQFLADMNGLPQNGFFEGRMERLPRDEIDWTFQDLAQHIPEMNESEESNTRIRLEFNQQVNITLRIRLTPHDRAEYG